MNIIELETPVTTEKHLAPPTNDIQPFFIPAYGITFKNTPCYQLRMNSPFASLQYVISGSGIIICDDKIYTVSTGDTFLLPEGHNHIYYSNPDNQFERIWINFSGELSDALLEIYKISDIVVFRNVDTLEPLSDIQKKCRELTEPEEYKAQTAQLFLKLVQLLARNKTAAAKAPDSTEKIRLYIDCHIMENVKISDIARNFSCSVEHIIRTFKRTYSITPHQYILQSKIRLAMIMLKTTELSIEEIAERLNFSDPRHFSTQFKKLIGYRPTQYRNG